MLLPLGLLPAITYVLIAYALRPTGGVAPLRLAAARAGLIVGAATATSVELLSAFHALTRTAVILAWSLALPAALIAAAVRRRHDGHAPAPLNRLRRMWADTTRAERTAIGALLGLILAELVIAVISPPNNYDSYTYHLPKIEHWVAQHDVDFFQTAIHRQLTLAPGAEYLLTHLRLMTGNDGLYNLLQWAAGAGCALLASRIAAQLGAGRRAQILTVFLTGTTPLVALEASSTQTDLTVAAWVACVATVALDGLHCRAPLSAATLLGLGTGLTALTKATGLLAVGPLLLLWGLAQLRQAQRPRHVLTVAVATLLIPALATIIFGPYLHRADTTYGHLLGPEYLTGSISMQRHDPAAILINALRIAHTALQTPLRPLNDATATGIEQFSRALGLDPNGRDITFWGSRFPFGSWAPDEDRASFPITGTAVLIGAALALLRPRTPHRATPTSPAEPDQQPPERQTPAASNLSRAYAAAFWVALLLHTATVKWQPWGNRLLLYLLILGAPLAGLWLDAALTRAHAPASTARRLTAHTLTAALVLSGCAGWIAVGYGWPRRLIGHDSVLTLDDMHTRFARRPQWLPEYQWAAAHVRASGARTIGLVQGNDSWEYPWWLLLRGDTIVSVQHQQPHLPAARADRVDALLCVAPHPTCARYVPRGWQLHMRGTVGYALPPTPTSHRPAR